MADNFLEFNMKITIDRGKFERETFGNGSKLDNNVRAAADAVLNQAQQYIGRRSGNLFSGHHPSQGHIADSGKVINSVTQRGSGQFGLVYLVVFDHNAASAHHEGAAPHIISPHGIVMKNPSQGAGGIPATYKGNGIFRAKNAVEHPGCAPNPYLTDAAKDIGLTPAGGLLRGTALTSQFRTPKSFA